ncbi:MAG: hypothetical protein AB200_01955 [Parcubacteria bacterium C7867-005]|nr:MAG: hypothetical protein AB200_01955 [Parcubacteria bacterium C7867-005]
MVLLKSKDAYRLWLKIERDLPKVERLGIGNKIDSTFLEFLEILFVSSYTALDKKLLLLGQAMSKHDSLKFFCQIAWENKLIHTSKYSELSAHLEEIGRMLGGWRKGLQTKLPAN